MTSDIIYQSDKKQSISDTDVANAIKTNSTRGLLDGKVPVPEAGRYCGKDKKHGLLLMSAKDGMLECGACGFKVAP